MFIRYNETNKYFEYDSAGGSGAGPWLKLPLFGYKFPVVYAQINGNLGHTTTTPADILSFTSTPANFPTNADLLHGSLGGIFAANTNAKTVTLSFDGATQITLSGIATGSAGSWYLEFWIQRATNSVMTGRYLAIYHNAAGTVTSISGLLSKSSLDFTANNYVTKVTIAGVATNDVIGGSSKIIYEPAT